MYNNRRSKNLRPYFTYHGGNQAGPISTRSCDLVGPGVVPPLGIAPFTLALHILVTVMIK